MYAKSITLTSLRLIHSQLTTTTFYRYNLNALSCSTPHALLLSHKPLLKLPYTSSLVNFGTTNHSSSPLLTTSSLYHHYIKHTHSYTLTITKHTQQRSLESNKCASFPGDADINCWPLKKRFSYPSPPSTRSNWSPLAMIN